MKQPVTLSYLLLLLTLKLCEPFSQNPSHSSISELIHISALKTCTRCTGTRLFLRDGDDDDEQTKKKLNNISLQDRINSFLDTPFFDPDQILEGNELDNEGVTDVSNNKDRNNNPIVWFAKLVKNDYETAEALYAAGFISILVIFTQELLRIVKYGDAYIPFTKIGSGSLF